MPKSLARVATGAAPRYAKQFASHFGRKTPVGETPDGGHRLTFDKTGVVLHPTDDHLLVEVTAPDLPTLTAIQDVVGGHLERFGRRNELTVAWEEPVQD